MRFYEDQVLTRYIWDHYSYLMTEQERERQSIYFWIQSAYTTDHLRMKAFMLERANKMAEQQGFEDMAVTLDQLECLDEFIKKHHQFRNTTCDRIVHDFVDKIFINRCPACDEIVLTPKAQQCLWCGHDWH
ncbi:MAG: hypothetical protein COA78_28935 [Blastopirellula sp.]|nr:MAG: hypothetical protein COA78_28935 [Blastopirellula sp.]